MTYWPHGQSLSKVRESARGQREWFMILITSQATIQMFKLDLDKAEELEIKLIKSTGL